MSRSIAPALVTAADIIEHDLDNNARHDKDRGQKLYYERWIHGEVYKARPDVNAVVHSHSPTVVPFASTKAPLKPLLHNASFLGFGAPDLRDPQRRAELGPHDQQCAARPRDGGGHGLGQRRAAARPWQCGGRPEHPDRVFRAYYTEINARQQLHAMALGPDDVVYMDAGECETTDKVMQSVAGRPWDLWKSKVMAKGS